MFQQDYQKFSPSVFHKTPEGYLTGRLCVTGAGVFRYLGDDRKFVGRLRSVDEVKKATDSINCKPVTLRHPSTPVSLDNVDQFQVGMSANDASFDGLNNWVTVTVTNKDAVEAIERGEVKAISMGYRCDVVDNAGVWQGSKHEQEQKDMVYNHIALVREGRAGDQVRFMVGDSAEAEDLFDIVPETEAERGKGQSDGKDPTEKTVVVNDGELNFHKQKEQSMKTIQLDGVDYQADEKVIEALQAAQEDASTKLEEIHTVLAANDELERQVADLQGQIDEAKSEIDESLIDEAVSAKLAILDTARSAGIECDASDDVSDLKRKVIEAAFDNIDLDSIDDESAINALYLSASKVLADANDNPEEGERVSAAAQLDGARNTRDGSENQSDSAEDRLWKKLYNMSNGLDKKEA